MGVPFREAQTNLDLAVKQLFGADPRIRSVGIGRHGKEYGYRVVRNKAMVLPLSAGAPAVPAHIANVPVVYSDTPAEVRRLVKLPAAGPGSPALASLVPEQSFHRPLVCGLQIQNYTDDTRQGILPAYMVVGSLGCFVRTAGGDPAILSNNHVVAGQNRGVTGTDAILQAGGAVIGTGQVALLGDYVPLKSSPPGASPAAGTTVFNDVDAASATLTHGVTFAQEYLSSRGKKDPLTAALTPLIKPHGTAAPTIGDRVFKVGRTTGLTYGEITDFSTVVGPIPYDLGNCWFQRCFTIIDLNGGHFSDHGDSGSAIIREATGEVLGLLFAGNGTETYVCAIDTALTALKCSLL
jgi:hypothetical protein